MGKTLPVQQNPNTVILMVAGIIIGLETNTLQGLGRVHRLLISVAFLK